MTVACEEALETRVATCQFAMRATELSGFTPRTSTTTASPDQIKINLEASKMSTTVWKGALPIISPSVPLSSWGRVQIDGAAKRPTGVPERALPVYAVANILMQRCSELMAYCRERGRVSGAGRSE